jgi:hypothetical protein
MEERMKEYIYIYIYIWTYNNKIAKTSYQTSEELLTPIREDE